MGVTNSKRVFSEDGNEKPAEKALDAPGAPEDKKEETAADGVKKQNMKMWKPYIDGIFSLNKKRIELIGLKFATGNFQAKESILSAPDDKEYIAKKIMPNKKDIINFAKGSGGYEKDLMEYVDKELLMKPDLKAITATTTEPGKSGISGNPTMNLKKDTKAEAVEGVFLSAVLGAKVAKRHHELLVVLNYVRDSDTFKAVFKKGNITGTDEFKAHDETKDRNTIGRFLTRGDKREQKRKDKLEEKSGNAPDGSEGGPSPPKEGGYDSDGGYNSDMSYYSDGGDSDGGDSDGGARISLNSNGSERYYTSDSGSSRSSFSSTGSRGGDLEGGDEFEGGDENDPDGGGRFFKNAAEKEAAKESKDNKKAYKDMKKGKKADIADKKKQFFNDTAALNKFLDANKADLFEMYENRDAKYKLKALTKNVKKDSPKKLVIANALLKALNEYEPGAADKDGISGQGAAPGAEGAPGDGGLNKGSSTDPASTEAPPAGAPPTDAPPAGAPPAGAPPAGPSDSAAPPSSTNSSTDSPPGAAGLVPNALPAGGEVPVKKLGAMEKFNRLNDRLKEKFQNKFKKNGGAEELSGGEDDNVVQDGGGKMKKKKKFTHKKPQRINISINVGNDNNISDTSSSSSSSSSSDSDDESEEDKNKVVVRHKKKKFTRRKHIVSSDV